MTSDQSGQNDNLTTSDLYCENGPPLNAVI